MKSKMGLINILMIVGVILAAAVPEVTGETNSEGRTTMLGGLSGSSSPTESCPDIEGTQVAGSVVKCYCQGNEILEDGICKPYGHNVVPVQHDYIYTKEGNTTNYNVTVRDVNCDSAKYFSLNFTKEQFQLRPRGDVVLLEQAGDLEGQRINKYCLIHQLDSHGNLTLTMKACIPIPSVPRCCPYGQAMKDGSCQPAKTPLLLQPPISAKPFSDSIAWSNITNYINPLKCESESMTTIPLYFRQSNLVSLADGLANGWVPEDTKRRIYYQCPEYCVDGIEKADGSTSYFTSFCYSDPLKEHKRACRNGPCIRKCCKKGYSMDENRYSCVPDSNDTFSIPTNFNTVTGWPLCLPVIKAEGEISINTDGSLNHKDTVIPSSDYCIDTFINNDRKQGALVCSVNDTPTWLKVRPVLFPVCQGISLMFLITTILCHLWAPGLLVNGGKHLLEYAVSLCIAYSASVALQVFNDGFDATTCFITAIAMQFGFLATFFWLSTVCFGIWREIRSLKNNLTTKSSQCSVYTALYGWGIPFCISLITVLMEKLAPDDVYGVIKPYIGVTRCWFKDDEALLAYFYGPLAIVILSTILLLVVIHYEYIKFARSSKGSTEIVKSVGGQEKIVQEKINGTRFIDHGKGLSRKLNILTFVVICWSTEVLSWKIPPLEIWVLTDTLNCLQGIFVFLIMLSDGTILKFGKKFLAKLRGKPQRYNVTSSDPTTKGNQPDV
ncbi:G-protein coupled receptor Mth2-like [Palaemon carinicauda]|uniref:G-protein coupled receptor Mth2-like n=1 Tax=Palaemon carinicauda TaxID=392227 RepID=UPI0035B5EA86